MSGIFGLSHLIFSSPSRILAQESPLRSFFKDPEFYKFDHSDVKKDLLRDKNSCEKFTHLSLYNSREGNLPSLELIFSESAISRPITKFGLLIPPSMSPAFNLSPKFSISAKFAEIHSLSRVYLEPDIPSLLAISPELSEHSCSLGAWTASRDIEESSHFFVNFMGAQILSKTPLTHTLRVKVMNRAFSNFLIIIVKDDAPAANFYNDDIGLAAFGWFCRKVPLSENACAGKRSFSPKFLIPMKKNFEARFIYDNEGQSHEIMAIVTPDQK